MLLNQHGSPATHLGYCTNIHAGEQWSDLFLQLRQYVPAVKKRVCPQSEFGLGLRASMQSITTLKQPRELEAFKEWLTDEGVYIYTVNGFPYGTFHGSAVKADVYKPDWSTQHRLDYTCAIADVLAQLAPPDNFASISSVPCTFRDWATPAKLDAIIRNLLACVTHCIDIKRKTDITIAVALEPEPACYLETIDDVLQFFKEMLYASGTIKQLASLSNTSEADAEKALHDHLGICYDICHAAVEFEDPLGAIKRMQNAGIQICKLQLSSALRLPSVNTLALDALKQFNEPVYLHQVVEKHHETLTRFHDLPLALQANKQREDKEKPDEKDCDREWRVHFHVPIFLSELDYFSTTQHDLERVLKAHACAPIAPHLEVETYTWDVLPEAYRNLPLDEAIARELTWVSEQLE